MINLTDKRKLSSLFEIFKDWEHEKLNIKFCKYILGVSRQSTNVAVISEIGRLPLYCDIILQMFMYWHRLERSPSDLMKSAYNEYKTNKHLEGKSWYSNILFLVKNWKLTSVCKAYSKREIQNVTKETH